MYVLDTNVISELRKARPHGGVLAWYESMPHSSYFLPSIVLYELQSGAEITRAHDPLKADEIETWIDAVQRAINLLPLDADSARLAARLMRKQGMELTEDALIAAAASTSRMTVATRNVRDFERFGVPIVNPFLYRG